MKPAAEPDQKPSISENITHSQNDNFEENHNNSRNTETKDGLDRKTTDSTDLPKLKK